MNKTQNMNIKYESYDFNIMNENPMFSEAKIYVMYHGENQNNTNISKESVDKALDSIYNVPIVGEFIKAEDESEESNFGSHGGQVVIDDDGISYIHTTRPVGVVPESARVYWEVVKDEKDREREYLVVEGALVWNRYEEEVNTLKSDNFGQSMEIEVVDGKFDDEKGIFHIEEFAFSAFCILGVDGRKNGEVKPAFEDSKIITYSKEDMVEEFKEMKRELKRYYASFSEQEEGNQVKSEKKKFNEEEKEEKVDEQENKDEETEEKESETVQTLEEGKAGDNQDIDSEAEAEKQRGTSGDTGAGDAATDEDARTVADDNIDADAGTDTITIGEDARTVADTNTDTDYAKEYKDLKKELDSLQSEVEELREFKRKADRETHEKEAIELFERVGLNEEDVEDLEIHDYTIDELEEKSYAILGKKMAQGSQDFSANEEKSQSRNKVDLSKAAKDKKTSKYGNLFAKYSK